MVIAPAYGRDYKTAKEAKEAFLEGKDFKCMSIGSGGTYCSVRDFVGKQIFIRFNKLMDVVVVQC